jgi:hypothetical protein
VIAGERCARVMGRYARNVENTVHGSNNPSSSADLPPSGAAGKDGTGIHEHLYCLLAPRALFPRFAMVNSPTPPG